MKRPLVKICGITRLDQAKAVAKAGADFIGLVLAPESPRVVHPGIAWRIVTDTRAEFPGVKFVGVFRNQPLDEVLALVNQTTVDLIQLHGDEDNDYVRAMPKPVIKALRVADAAPDWRPFPDAAWFLFDTYSTVAGGGTGATFDWTLLSERPDRPFFLAGGLTPDNVAAAVKAVHPDAVDVSSGVETVPGLKNLTKVGRLFDRLGKS